MVNPEIFYTLYFFVTMLLMLALVIDILQILFNNHKRR